MEIRGEMREAWAKRRQRSLTAEVREELERMILQGDIEAGARLNEHALAERMGVSRGPVREAARALERDGLLTSIANRGSFVRELSVEDASELYELRALLKGRLCEMAALRSDAATCHALDEMVAAMDEAIEAGDEEGYFVLNLDFHERIAAAAQSSRTHELYASLGKEVRLLRWHGLRGRATLTASNDEHRRIVAAITAKDTEAARREGAAHHRNGKRRWLEKL